MQTSFGYEVEDANPVERAKRGLLDAIRRAVANISIKELAYRLDVSPSLLADAMAERSSKGVRASWLVTIIAMADEDDALAILNEFAALRRCEVTAKTTFTPEQLNERYEEKFMSMGPIGVQAMREAKGERR